MPQPTTDSSENTFAEDHPQYWNDVYSGEVPWDAGAPVPPLMRAAQFESLARATDVAFVGCGYGHDACYWAEQGFKVTGFDFAPAAITAARERAAALGLSNVRFAQHNVFELAASYAEHFDVVVEYTCFCAINPARRPLYVTNVASILRPGGIFIGLFYPFAPRESNPPYPVSLTAIETLFLRPPGPFELLTSETPTDSIPRRLGAERLLIMRRC